MDNKFIGLVVGLVVGVLLIGSLLVPTIGDATTTEKTFTNEGMFFMTDNDDYTLVYDPSGKFVVNGEDIPFTNLPAGERVTIVSTEEFLLRFPVDSSVHYSISWIGTSATEICKDTDAVTTTFTFSDGTLTITKSGSADRTYTYTSESFRGISKTGDYVMTLANTPTKVRSDTTIIVGNGTTDVAHWYDRFYIEGTVEDMTVTPNEGITVSNVVVNSTPIDGYVDLAEFTSVQFTATSGEYSADATYNRVIVPVEVTAELSEHLSSGEIAILAVIPVLMIVSLLIFAVRFVTRD